MIGLYGIAQAARAKRLAAAANALAAEANRISKGANTLSEEANRISLEANEISRRSDERATETHDVHWECLWESVGSYAVTNLGRDTARAARISITVDDEIKKSGPQDIGPGETVTFEFPIAAATFWEEEAERRRLESQPSDPRLTRPAMLISPMFGRDHYIRDRILWNTEHGNPEKHDIDSSMCSLSP